MIQKFNLEEIPYGELKEFGLTANKIQDLPYNVLGNLLAGRKTPLIKMSYQTQSGKKVFEAKIRLVREDFSDQVSVMYSPKPAVKDNLGYDFTEQEQKKLDAGSPLFKEKNVEGDGNEEKVTTQVIIQKDRDTNQFVEVPMEPIGRNLKTLANNYDLTASNIQQLKQGHIVTIDHPDNSITSIGIDLSTDEGILLVEGDESDWYKTADQKIEKYNFGEDGCWINEDGTLDYVEEKDFDEKLKAIQRSIGQEYSPAVEQEEEETEHREYHEEQNQDDSLEEQQQRNSQEEEEEEEEAKKKVGY